MRFTVPQFIEMEPKIVGPLTFKQFLFIGIAGAISVFFYFTIGKTSFLLFLLISVVLIGGGLALAFLKIDGRSLPTILGNSLKFLISPKFYIWQKEKREIKISKEEKIKETNEKETSLKITERSQLRKLRTQVEIKTK